MNEKLRFEIKAKNNRLHELIYSRHKTLADFCDLEGLKYNSVCAFLNLSMSPYNGNNGRSCDGRFSPSALRLCEIFSMDPIELFPPEIYGKGQRHNWIVKKNINQLTMNEVRPQVEYIDEKDIIPSEIIRQQIDTLDDRTKKVINYRYGLFGNTEHTIIECGKKLGLSRERVRQLEEMGIRKLRHPTRSKILRNAL